MLVSCTASAFQWASLPGGLQVFDIVSTIGFVLYVVLVCRGWRLQKREAKESDALAMAASSVGMLVTLGVAAAAVLLTGAGVLLALEGGATPLPHAVFTQLVLATCWLVASLICGAISASYVITHIHHATSVAENPLVVTFATGQLIALVVGALYFVLSIFLF